MQGPGGKKEGGMVSLFLAHMLEKMSFKKDSQSAWCVLSTCPTTGEDNHEENGQIPCFYRVRVLLERGTKQEK